VCTAQFNLVIDGQFELCVVFNCQVNLIIVVAVYLCDWWS